MLTSELIRDKFGLGYMDDELTVLDKLAGKEIVLHLFNDDANKWITGSHGQTPTYFLTRYLLPIANHDHLTVGIHLLPSYVAQERFVVAQFDPESELIMHIPCARTFIECCSNSRLTI